MSFHVVTPRFDLIKWRACLNLWFITITYMSDDAPQKIVHTCDDRHIAVSQTLCATRVLFQIDVISKLSPGAQLSFLSTILKSPTHTDKNSCVLRSKSKHSHLSPFLQSSFNKISSSFHSLSNPTNGRRPTDDRAICSQEETLGRQWCPFLQVVELRVVLARP